MEVYKFAIEFEQETRDYYEECAKQTDNQHLKKIFNDLAAKEREHEKVVRKLAEEEEIEIEEQILSRAKDTFAEMAKEVELGEEEKLVSKEQVDVYKKAMELEKRSYEFYEKKAEEVYEQEVKDVLERLAKEERNHEEIMHNIVVIVDRPNTWLDDAEWYHMEDY